MFVDTDTILSVLNIYHVMLWVGKHAISIYSQFLRGVFTTRSGAGICMNMSRVLAGEVWVSRVCSRRKCCLQCKAEAVKPRPSMSLAMFCPHRPRCCKHYRQHWRLCFCATGYTLFCLSIWGHHFHQWHVCGEMYSRQKLVACKLVNGC